MGSQGFWKHLGKQEVIIQFHTTLLSGEQFKVLRQIGQVVSDQGFYLVDGMALAINYGHRRSEDLDWFTSQPLVDPMIFAQQHKPLVELQALYQKNINRKTLHRSGWDWYILMTRRPNLTRQTPCRLPRGCHKWDPGVCDQ